MSYLDTLFVNGHDIRTAFTGLTVYGTIDHWAPGDRRGEDETIPGRNGDLDTQLPRASFVILVSIQVTGATRGERNDNLRDAIALMRGSDHGLVPIKRRIATGTGSAYEQGTARGRVLTAASSILNPYTGRGALQIKNLDGAWKDSGGTFRVP
jgi:hypothetical protein